ncbi:MAG: hypothetical protein JWM68_3253 [Verrucomicrobiales bacterium]|nr:hypothetical protein [Verrucomicrobiales bacterium]
MHARKSNFTLRSAFATLPHIIRHMKKFLPILILPLFVAGCSTVTNLTPRTQERAGNNTYPVEMKWVSNQHALKPETVHPVVIVGTESIPMQPIPVVKNRWEAFIPVAPNENVVRYKYKVNYEVSGIPVPQKESKSSAEYKMEIKEKK